MRRQIENIGYRVTSDLDMDGFAGDLEWWFVQHSDLGAQIWLLAHAVDGVIWGKIEQGKLVHSGDLFPGLSPRLRASTLMEARLFSSSAEVHIWRGEAGFTGCIIEDAHMPGALAFDERQRLWGTIAKARQAGFTLLADGREGLQHALPLDVPDSAFARNEQELYRPVVLRTRQYIGFDEMGRAQITASRLVDVTIEAHRVREGRV
jgi:CRISPR-associated protein (TIGR03984 family)